MRANRNLIFRCSARVVIIVRNFVTAVIYCATGSRHATINLVLILFQLPFSSQGLCHCLFVQLQHHCVLLSEVGDGFIFTCSLLRTTTDGVSLRKKSTPLTQMSLFRKNFSG